MRLGNSEILNNLSSKFGHLERSQRDDLVVLIDKYKDLFPDIPGWAEGMYHDVDVGDATPIKQYPYKVGTVKKAIMDKEIQYMLENNIIEPFTSPRSSPCLLAPKPDGSSRFCTDFRRVNAVTKTDCYPLPLIDTLIDQVGSARCVSKFDLLKGYWQVPLTERAKEVSAFCTGNGLFCYLVCPFGMKNSGCTFQRFMDIVVSGLSNTQVYVDDLIVNSETRSDHEAALRTLFERLRKHKLTVSLAKSDFARATVQYLGHVVGQGKILPATANI